MELCEKLKDLRKKRGISQQELADSIFVTDEWITEFYVDGHLLTVDDEINYD